MTQDGTRRREGRHQRATRGSARLAAAMMCVLALGAIPAGAQEFFTLKGHGGPIKGISTDTDGTILTASFDNSVGVWTDGRPRWLEGHEAAVNAVVADGPGRVISAGDDFSVRLWDVDSGTSRVLGRHLGKVIRLALSPDGRTVASASWDGTATIWALDGAAAPIVLEGHAGGVNDVAYSADGKHVYTASADGTIRVWDGVSGTFLRQLVRHGFGVNALVLASDESWIAYGAVDGGTRVISLPDGAVVQDFTLERRPILAMAYSPQAHRIAVGDAQGFIMMVDTDDWRISEDFRATLSGPIWALAFAPDGRNIHAGGLDNALYSWPVAGLDSATVMAGTERSFLAPPGEMSNGERQFQRKCSICHTLGPDGARRAGPSLHELFGRPAGSLDGYAYSDTLGNSDIVWSDETIDRLFDLGPDHFIPGSKMPMQRILAPEDREDLIAFLRVATTRGGN